MKVKATKKYEELNVQDLELKRIPKAEEEFEVSEERFEILNGKNTYKTIFVKKVEEDIKDNETPKTTKKKTRKK